MECVQVETNDVVTVASMTHPKLLPNEAMSDLAVNMENTVNAWDMENAESDCLYIFLLLIYFLLVLSDNNAFIYSY